MIRRRTAASPIIVTLAGDVVYNHCHMFVGETTAAIRAEWIAAIDQLAALHPSAVVTGHKDPTCGNPPSACNITARSV